MAWLLCFAVVVLGSCLVDIMTGPAMLSMREVIAAIFHWESTTSTHQTILWTFRLPTALMAVFVGSALGIAGAEMQTILNNPLASPYTLGVSAAASFGAALAMVCGIGSVPVLSAFGVPLSAFVFALLCSLAIYAVAHLKGGSTETLVLSGVALLFLFNAAVAFLQYIASEDVLQAIVFWIFGSLQGATWFKLAVIAVVMIAVVPLIAMHAWQLTALRLGDQRARSLGINIRRLRLQILFLVSILTATAVSFTGSIGFVGLIAPHLARSFVGEDQRFFLPLSGLLGALLLSVASIATKWIVPGGILPIGITTAFLGVPFFVMMILHRKKEAW